MPFEKTNVKDYWEQEACGVRYGHSEDLEKFLLEIENSRYRMEPFIPQFSDFKNYAGRKVLEIGLGAGTDFRQWVKNDAVAVGLDITEEALRRTEERLSILNPEKNNFALIQGDAENLCFHDDYFDLVYSYGCFHHVPNPEAAIKEAFRVSKPGGRLKAMIYHVPSWTGWLLWFLHCFLKGKPWQSPREAIFKYLESPGTKAYTIEEAKRLFENAGFLISKVTPKLGPGDLLDIKLSKKYESPIFKILQRLYPRWLVRLLGDQFGLNLLIEARKPA